MYPTKVCIELDDPDYPKSWRNDHFAPDQVRGASSQDNPDAPINTWD